MLNKALKPIYLYKINPYKKYNIHIKESKINRGKNM